MSLREYIVAFLAGIVQGVVEWLPVSSQGNLSMFLTIIGMSPDIALQLALFLQVGTTVSAAVYYRSEIIEAVAAVPSWRPETAFEGPNGITSFVAIACIATGIIGIPLYLFALDIASELAGGVFILLIGVLLVFTGVVQLVSESMELGGRNEPTLVDAILIGSLQGLSILPGVSRSGVTTSALLFRSYQAPAALRLSFLLSIPAGIGAGVLTVLNAGGLPGVSPQAALVAFVTSAVVGYITISSLMRIVARIPFWAVCFGLGGLAIAGGAIVTVWY